MCFVLFVQEQPVYTELNRENEEEKGNQCHFLEPIEADFIIKMRWALRPAQCPMKCFEISGKELWDMEIQNSLS